MGWLQDNMTTVYTQDCRYVPAMVNFVCMEQERPADSVERPAAESGSAGPAEVPSTSEAGANPQWTQTIPELPGCVCSPEPAAPTANLQTWASLSGQEVLANVIQYPQWARYFAEIAQQAMVEPADPISLLRAVQAGGAPLYALAQVGAHTSSVA